MIYDTIIIGSGAAGLSAGLYAVRYKLKTLIVKGDFGGETARAGVIWNYPGVIGIDGYELMKVMEKQAKDGGVEIISGKATKILKQDNSFEVAVGEKTFATKTIIFAVGTERGHLNLPNETELTNKGVHYCFTCDAPLYGDKVVAVVGAGDAAFKGALLAAEYCKKIVILVRSDKVRAEPATVEQVKARPNIEILYSTEVKEIVGKDHLEKIILSKPYNGSNEFVLDGLFIEIGARPNSALAVSLGVELDSTGYVVSDALMTTNIPGFFAAGDTVNLFGHFKQDITAAALGAVAATSAYHYAAEK
ncbi:MAG: NAD(P)/FAD-dependent oxidoreductase [Candidatus Paceibacterota bacterium]|jgi:thioredoxin reductase (NADPH)